MLSETVTKFLLGSRFGGASPRPEGAQRCAPSFSTQPLTARSWGRLQLLMQRPRECPDALFQDGPNRLTRAVSDRNSRHHIFKDR